MAIKLVLKKRFHGITWKSGYIYNFKYSSWQNDPEPTIILMYAVQGINPNTGHEHHYFQGVNFTYIPRPVRKVFAREWANEFESSRGDVKFTYNKLKRKYPYLRGAIRRYFYKPTYYISKAREIPMEDMEDVIVSTWSKDFSKKIRVDLAGKFRRVMGNRKKIQDKNKSPSFFRNIFKK